MLKALNDRINAIRTELLDLPAKFPIAKQRLEKEVAVLGEQRRLWIEREKSESDK